MVTENWKRILTATDFSPLGNSGVEYANCLAEDLGAELHVLHIVRSVSDVASKHGPTGILDPAGVEAEGQNWLREILGQSSLARRVETIQIGHNVAEKIIQYAIANDIQLIVMATHGRTGLAHFWIGSITEDVVHSAPCPVLVIRSAGVERKNAAEL
jgi:nucleotide-binding universal stress UspA family protein